MAAQSPGISKFVTASKVAPLPSSSTRGTALAVSACRAFYHSVTVVVAITSHREEPNARMVLGEDWPQGTDGPWSSTSGTARHATATGIVPGLAAGKSGV